MDQEEYLKSSAFATSFTKSNHFSPSNPPPKYSPYTMRFISNAFIVSTVALLSLITPGVNANVAQITNPASGQTFNVHDSVEVTWTVTNSQGLGGVNCDIALLHTEDAPVPASPGILQSGVPILNGESNGGQSNGPVQIPDVTSGDNYFLQLLSSDQSTVFAQSGTFTIA
ncbi:hypothetical protein F5888DRAFT_1802095 [Russula emetica]|nr:hypothetical protein F5888DRAFT_1802095 [Russula emetica]